MFPAVRRIGFLFAISIRCMPSLCLNLTNAIDSKIKIKMKKNEKRYCLEVLCHFSQ